jgi:hypothetical protein
MKRTLLLLAGIMAGAVAAPATVFVAGWTNGVNATFASGGVVPDNSPSGWTDSRTLTTAPAGSIAANSLGVNLQLTGGWNGDLFAYLVNGSGFVVLLDRVGVGESGVGASGYSGAGMNVTLANSGTTSIHAAGNGLITGAWLPDAANAGVLTAANSGSLAGFDGLNPNSTWSLFIADLSGGGVSTVQSWGLQMDIVAVPEVETWVAAALAGAFGAFWLNRQIWRGVKP